MKLTGMCIVLAWLIGALPATSSAGQRPALPTPDIHYVPTSNGVTDAMLKLAQHDRRRRRVRPGIGRRAHRDSARRRNTAPAASASRSTPS